MSLLSELRRRKVIRVAAAYIVAAWLAVQAASIVLPAFEAPAWAMRACILILLLGLPIALVVSWAVELTPEGTRIEWRGSGSKRLFAIAALLALLAFGWFFFGQRVLLGSATAPVASVAPAPVAPDYSIAVLPFVSMSSDEEQAYFSDGLSEELLNMLSQVPQLRVIARTSSFSFKGKDADVATIAKALNVAHILEGSVRKSGTTVRITAQLVRTADSTHLWSQTYDRELDDVLGVQDEIAGAVVAALRVKLLPEQRVTNPHGSAVPEAYNEFLLGRRLLASANQEGYVGAVAAFQRAIALDPGYAAAYAALAFAEVFAADFAASEQANAAAKQRARTAVETAIALAPNSSDGYVARGWLRSNFLWDWKGSLSDYEKAQALGLSDSTGLRHYAQMLGSQGRLDESIAVLRKGSELDPLSSPMWGNLGFYLTAAGDYPAARQALERALALNPDSSFSHWNLAQALLLQGDAARALALFDEAGDGFRQTGVALAQHTLANEVESKRALDALISAHAADWSFQIAEVHAWRNENDEAFAWLDRAYAQRDSGLSDIKIDPLLAGLREDRRFAALLAKMGL